MGIIKRLDKAADNKINEVLRKEQDNELAKKRAEREQKQGKKK